MNFYFFLSKAKLLFVDFCSGFEDGTFSTWEMCQWYKQILEDEAVWRLSCNIAFKNVYGEIMVLFFFSDFKEKFNLKLNKLII